MVKPACIRPDDLALAKEMVPLVAVPPGVGEQRSGEPADLAATARPAPLTEGHRGPPGALPIRSAERRRWAADLTGPSLAGLVLHGIGGIGKSALASQITSRVTHLEPERVTAVMTGEVSVDGVLAGVAAALRRHPAMAQGGGEAQSVRAADRADLPWAHRLALLRELVLGQVPVLLVLDDFDDNLSPDSGSWTIRNAALAELIASWASESHRGKLLITCRHPFSQPGTVGPRLAFRHVGPLSRSGAFELARSLPALGRLGDEELDRAWRLLGGHPHAMNYLDSLLDTGDVRFGEVARRLAPAIGARPGGALSSGGEPGGPPAPTELTPAAAETVALAAGDLLLGELFDRLSAGARNLLIRALAEGGPVSPSPLIPPAGQTGPAPVLSQPVAECAAAGLLTADLNGDPYSLVVPRWTAGQLRHLAAQHRSARPWRSRRAAGPALAGLLVVAAAGAFVVGHPAPPVAHAEAGAPPGAAAVVLQQASAVRARAAAWVARQVSRDAIVACDPDMCSALLAQRIAPGNLLELRVSTPDPLGSDVLVATAAVRSQFGARLASVYAPAVLASFGSRRLRIDVRAIAPDGATAYRAALASDLMARRAAGRQLLGNPHVQVSSAARGELQAGQVDSRLLTTLAALATAGPVQVGAFSDSGPGASAGMPLRSAVLTAAGRAAPAALQAMLAFVRAQRPPYLPARSLIELAADGSSLLNIEFAAPDPTGLLQAAPTR